MVFHTPIHSKDTISEGLDCQAYQNDPVRLVLDICADKQRALSCLFKQLETYMMGSIKRSHFWRDKHSELKKEAFLDAFVVLIQKIQNHTFTLEEQATIQTYFFRIYQLCLKSHKRKKRTETEKLLAYLAQQKVPLDSDQEINYEVDRLRLVEQALTHLKDDCRKLVNMRIYQGLSYQEIKEILPKNRSVNALKMQYSRCISSLKNTILSCT